jgi:hypothetical protein
LVCIFGLKAIISMYKPLYWTIFKFFSENYVGPNLINKTDPRAALTTLTKPTSTSPWLRYWLKKYFSTIMYKLK